MMLFNPRITPLIIVTSLLATLGGCTSTVSGEKALPERLSVMVAARTFHFDAKALYPVFSSGQLSQA